MNKPLSSELLNKMNAYWRAANYLSVGQIYLYGNPLLKAPFTLNAGAHKAAAAGLLGYYCTRSWMRKIRRSEIGSCKST